MSDTDRKPNPPASTDVPVQESLRAEFGEELDAEPAYGEARLWAVARDPHCIFAYWQFRPAEHPESVGNDGVSRFYLRILREDLTEETTVAIEPGAGNWFIPVSQPDSGYFAELGFFSNDVWCFIARSRGTRTPPEAASGDALEFFATIPARLSLRRLRELLAAAAVPGEEVAETASRVQSAAQAQGDWTEVQERMLAHILFEEMEKNPVAPGSSATLAQRIRHRLAAAEEAAGPVGPLPPLPEEAAPGSKRPRCRSTTRTRPSRRASSRGSAPAVRAAAW
ncbi:MAG: DUF4912 domain-containing protein [Chthoniobacteraceae bacterium]